MSSPLAKTSLSERLLYFFVVYSSDIRSATNRTAELLCIKVVFHGQKRILFVQSKLCCLLEEMQLWNFHSSVYLV